MGMDELQIASIKSIDDFERIEWIKKWSELDGFKQFSYSIDERPKNRPRDIPFCASCYIMAEIEGSKGENYHYVIAFVLDGDFRIILDNFPTYKKGEDDG